MHVYKAMIDIYPTVHSAKCDILLGGESLVLNGVFDMELFTLGETVGVVNPLALALNNKRSNEVYCQMKYTRKEYFVVLPLMRSVLFPSRKMSTSTVPP